MAVGPIRDALERMKTLAEVFGVTIEQAADMCDLLTLKEQQRKAAQQQTEAQQTDGLMVPGPTRAQ